MSASDGAMRGGQASATLPIATPWLSPKVVTRKRWPKVLNDMEFHSPPGGSPRVSRGQMSLRDEDAGHRLPPGQILIHGGRAGFPRKRRPRPGQWNNARHAAAMRARDVQ